MWADGKRRLFIDLETYGEVDIRAAGALRYIEDPSFEVMLIQYAFDDEPVNVLDICSRYSTDYEDVPEIQKALQDPSIVKVAHNCIFERTACHRYLDVPYMPPEQWEDTMVMSAYNGLPLSLDASGAALGIVQQKMKEGKGLINYFSKPCKPTKANGGRTRNRPEDAPDKWETFKRYGGRDVEAMREIYHRLCDYPVTPFEREVFCCDVRINERGAMIDRELASAAVELDETFKAARFAEMKSLTGLENPGSVQQLKGWLADRGIVVDSLGKAVVSDLLSKDDLDLVIRRVLELRQLLGKTSTKKYSTMLAAAGSGDRVRGMTQYYGANRTGRWCIAEGSLVLVLTDRGAIVEKPIESVSDTDFVWDGARWVPHDGVIYRGDREVITWDGVTATPDHEVFISPTEKVPLEYAMDNNIKLWSGC